MDRIILLLLVAFVAIASDALPVVTGNTVVHDLTVRIGGDRVAATCLLRPGIDPHTYQPVPEDVRRLADARLVVINGLGFEGWFEKLAQEARFAGTVVVASAGITPLTMAAENDAGQGSPATVPDPHAFNAIRNGVRYAENIRDALMAADPAGADGYRTRADACIADLRAADAWAQQEIARIPRAQRKLVTNHDALQYFARDYGFTVLAAGTALEDSQPSAADIASLVAFIRTQGVHGVFFEFGKNDTVVGQIAAEAGVKAGHELYLDGLGPHGSGADTYVGMFRANVTSIVEGLR